MKLVLERLQLDPDVTIGSLSLDGDWECWTLEDAVRPSKIPGITAIDAGTYGVTINQSARFKRLLPLLLNVPEFTGVRIHPGNTQHDTEGCILVGADRLTKSIGRSRKAFDALFTKLWHAYKHADPITIEITQGTAP